jgi:hypothetical protein
LTAIRHIPSGSGIWGLHVKNYSMVRIGDEYVVRADEKKHFESREPQARRALDYGSGGAFEFATASATTAAGGCRAINRA